jgi:hypothetical protein
MIRTLLATAAISLAASVASAATVDVDSFTDTLTTGDVVGSAGATTTVADALGSYLGTNREITASIEETVMGGISGVAASSNRFFNGRFEFEAASEARGSWSLLYTGISSFDFTNTLLAFDDVISDAVFDLTVSINGGAPVAFVIPELSMETAAFNISAIPGADAVTSLFIRGESREFAGDISFDLITTTPIPVPAAGLLLLGGMGAFAAVRRRKH